MIFKIFILLYVIQYIINTSYVYARAYSYTSSRLAVKGGGVFNNCEKTLHAISYILFTTYFYHHDDVVLLLLTYAKYFYNILYSCCHFLLLNYILYLYNNIIKYIMLVYTT